MFYHGYSAREYLDGYSPCDRCREYICDGDCVDNQASNEVENSSEGENLYEGVCRCDDPWCEGGVWCDEVYEVDGTSTALQGAIKMDGQTHVISFRNYITIPFMKSKVIIVVK